MKTNIIGISGRMGSGKDTVGIILQGLSEGASVRNIKYIIENSFDNPPPGAYQIKKFADKLKDITCLLIGCTREQLEDREFKEKELGEEWNKLDKIALMAYNKDNPLCHEKGYLYNTMTPRKLLQLLGTECGRQIIHPNIWINALFADYIGDNVFIATEKDEMSGTQELIYPNWIITDCRFPNEAQAIKDRGGIVIRVNRDIEYPVSTNEHPSETALDYYEFDHVIENDGSIEELIEKVKQLKLV